MSTEVPTEEGTLDAPVAELPIEGAPVRDGIGEEDNPIPLWFNVGFYGLMAWGVVYIIYFMGTGWTQAGRFAVEAAAAEERYAAIRAEMPTENPYRGDAAALAEGKELWATICVACHLPDGQGLVGPSVIDPYWKYGDSDEALFETVNDGRPLGMPPWGPTLGAEKIWKVLAYMETLPRTDEPGIGSPEYEAAQKAAAGAP